MLIDFNYIDKYNRGINKLMFFLNNDMSLYSLIHKFFINKQLGSVKPAINIPKL